VAVFLLALPSSPVCIIPAMIRNTGTDKAPVDHTVQGGWGQTGQLGFPKVQNTRICSGFFQTRFHSSDRRQYSGSHVTKSGSKLP